MPPMLRRNSLSGYFIELLDDPNNQSALLAGIRQRFAATSDRF